MPTLAAVSTVESSESVDATTSAQREARGCDRCNQTDDHPRHIIYAAAAHPISGQVMDMSQVRHIDCCADAGCAICKTDLEFVGGGVKGPELVAAMTDKSAEHHQALFDRHGVESLNHQIQPEGTQ